MSPAAIFPVDANLSYLPNLFSGAVVLVTGGTSGIGYATACAFAGLGPEVHAMGLESARMPSCTGVTPHELDVTDAAVASALINQLPRIDVLVNAAGVADLGGEFEAERFDRVLQVNLTGALRMATLARPAMVRSGGGSIVNLSSMFATFGSHEAPAYASSKGGIDQLTRSLAVAWAPDHIRINAVQPGWIDTPLLTPLKDNPAYGPVILARTPMTRYGRADEVAQAIIFLCSPAASFITGAILPIDGGYLCV